MQPGEKVLVVERKKLFGENNELCFEGFRTTEEISLLDRIKEHGFFMDRQEAENNPDYLQVIAFILVKKDDKFFAVQKLPATGDKREVGLYSICVGGHLNPIDGEDALMAGAAREFAEEVKYNGKFNGKLIGYVNSETDMFNKVHLGAVFLQEVNEDVDVHDAEKDVMRGELMDLKRMEETYSKFGFWSQSIIDNIERFL